MGVLTEVINERDLEAGNVNEGPGERTPLLPVAVPAPTSADVGDSLQVSANFWNMAGGFTREDIVGIHMSFVLISLVLGILTGGERGWVIAEDVLLRNYATFLPTIAPTTDIREASEFFWILFGSTLFSMCVTLLAAWERYKLDCLGLLGRTASLSVSVFIVLVLGGVMSGSWRVMSYTAYNDDLSLVADYAAGLLVTSWLLLLCGFTLAGVWNGACLLQTSPRRVLPTINAAPSPVNEQTPKEPTPKEPTPIEEALDGKILALKKQGIETNRENLKDVLADQYESFKDPYTQTLMIDPIMFILQDCRQGAKYANVEQVCDRDGAKMSNLGVGAIDPTTKLLIILGPIEARVAREMLIDLINAYQPEKPAASASSSSASTVLTQPNNSGCESPN